MKTKQIVFLLFICYCSILIFKILSHYFDLPHAISRDLTLVLCLKSNLPLLLRKREITIRDIISLFIFSIALWVLLTKDGPSLNYLVDILIKLKK